MENQGKTIKQIADELGVSKQAVYKKIDNLDLRSSLQKIANQFTIDKHQEKLIKSAFLENKSPTKITNQVDEIANQSPTSLQLISILQSTIDLTKTQNEQLKSELDIKNKQIEDLNAELAKERKHNRAQSETIAVLADQAQKLQLAQMKSQITDGEHLTREEPQDVPVPATAPEQAKSKKSWKWWK